MRKILGFRGNSVQITKLNFDYERLTLEAEVSIVDNSEGSATIIAYTRCTSWDERTKEKLLKFIEELERDVCRQLGKGSRAGGPVSILEALGEDIDESGDTVSREDTRDG